MKAHLKDKEMPHHLLKVFGSIAPFRYCYPDLSRLWAITRMFEGYSSRRIYIISKWHQRNRDLRSFC